MGLGASQMRIAGQYFRSIAFYTLVATWTSLPVDLHGQIDCIRLDDHQSPTSFSSAWNQYSPTRFEVADGGLGEVQLRFDDSQAGVVIVFDATEGERFVRLSEGVMSSRVDQSDGVAFTAWFKLGPTWHRTGPHMGRGVLSRSTEKHDAADQYRLEFGRMISEKSSFTSYQPAALYFSAGLLTQVAAIVNDGIGQDVSAISHGRACGYAGIIPDQPGQ